MCQIKNSKQSQKKLLKRHLNKHFNQNFDDQLSVFCKNAALRLLPMEFAVRLIGTFMTNVVAVAVKFYHKFKSHRCCDQKVFKTCF
jgi:hypothetical protein